VRGAAAGFSKSKLYRIENGRSRVDADDLEDMLDLYDVRSPNRDALIQFGRESRRRGWWTRYKDVFTGSYVALESEAASIRINAHLVPGFLQTPAYARAVIAATGPWLETDDSERRVVARTARRAALLGRDHPPDMHVVLDESVLRRQVGGPGVLRDQLAELAEASDAVDELECRFHRAMVGIYETAKRELGYNATRFLQMLSEQGGLATARQLL
jgi:hypothetical protein